MSKRIKMVLYGEPGVGKSVFASKAPKPFFICTDGNYEWLEDFGADPNAHLNATTWSEIKKMIDKPESFEGYETIVLDLTEDAFKWCESEFCLRQKIDHLSDLGFGKGYDATRNEFFIAISKLLALDKNVILIMHGITTTEKDRRGVDHTKYVPTSRIPDKVLDMIEGRVRYFLRCYLKDEEHDDGTVTKTRRLSLVPKPNEFGIIRGVDENVIEQDIPLDWNEFIKAIGFSSVAKTMPVERVVTKEEAEQDDIKDAQKKIEESTTGEEPRQKRKYTRRNKVETTQEETNEEVSEETNEPQSIESKEAENTEPQIATETSETQTTPKAVSNEDKLAAIKAKLAALNKVKE